MTLPVVFPVSEREVERAEGGQRLRARVQVPANSAFFEGHFPGHPLLPGVVQVCRIVLPEIERLAPKLGPPVASPRLKFRAMILPGDELTLVLHLHANATARFRLLRGDAECSSGTFEFAAPP